MKQYNGMYLMGNYPDEDSFIQAALKGLEFFDFMEIGLPFSDPVADGEVISNAAHAALEKGVSPDHVFRNIKKIRAMIPVEKHLYVMTYANHVYHAGIERFMDTCADAGVNGIILPDVPSREAARFRDAAGSRGTWYVQFITPESSTPQVMEAARQSTGFLYTISVRGITGGASHLSGEVLEKVQAARQLSRVPVVLGFGIKTPGDAMNALSGADGFIMGTRLVDILQEGGIPAFSEFIDELANNYSV